MSNTKLLRNRKKSFIEGNHISRLPFGYEKNDESVITQNKDITVVKEIFRLRDENLGYMKIATTLKLLDVNNKPRTIFVKNILENPFYAGYIRYDDKVIEGNHHQIINLKEFLKLNTAKSIEEFINK